jgi:hypothetical protein
MAGWYRQGTVALTPGSAAVAGAGTMWMGVVRPGSAFTTDGRTLYEIREVANDHTLTLDRPWEGETTAASAYAVIAASATLSNTELAGEVAAMVAKWAVREDQYDDWLGGSPNGGPNHDGKYPLTDSKGVTRLVESPARLLQLLDDGVVEHAAQIIAAIEDDVTTARQAATEAAAAMTAVSADRQAVAQAAATVAAQAGESTAAAATAAAQAAIAAQRAGEAASSAVTAAGLEASATAALAAVETARDIVLEARTEAGTAATGALSSRTAAEAARDTATAARDAALEARDAAETARTQAQDWAVKTDAPVSGSLKSALSYALDAASQATAATGKAMEAAGSAAAAAASAADLDTAAANAQAAAGDAATGAQTATVKAAAAALSADIARSAAQQAETAGTGSATARTAAEAARDTAATAMTAAQVAASQAGQSQTNAANSAQTAATAAADAISAKSDATSARDLAVAARTDAQGARDLAQAFAQGAVGYQPSPGVYSAFHWSEQAKGHAQTAATIVGGSNFGIVGDGTSQRFAAENPGSLLNLVQAPGGKLTFNPGSRAVSFGFDATTAPVATSGGITAGTVQGALEEIDHRLSTLSQDSIANGGGSVQVTADGTVEIAPAAGRTATYKGGELHSSATAYGKAETDAAIAAATNGLATVARTGAYDDLLHKPDVYTRSQTDGAIAAMIAAGQAAGAAKLTTPRSIALSGGVTGTATAFDGTQDIAIPVTAVSASALTGTIDIARLPAGALERLYPVANDAERFALTTAQVQKGDTVQVGGTGGLMYLVIDESNLGNAAGYRAYTAARASAVDWSGVESKPALLTALASLDANSGVLVQTGAGTAAKRGIGTAASTDIPDRAAADGRYAQLGTANNFATAPTVAGNSVWHAAYHPTTVLGYGITDAYSRTETDSAISTAISTLSPNGIGQGDTSVTVTDSGSNGKITLKADNVVKAEVTASGVDFKDQPTVNGQPLAGNSITKSAVTVLPATGTINVPAKTILSVYSQFVGQTFNVDYNTEAQYTQENAATGTDQAGGAFQLYNTAGAQIDSATKLLIHADGVNGSTEIVDERGVTPFGTHCAFIPKDSRFEVPKSYKLAFGPSQNFTFECWVRITPQNASGPDSHVFDCCDSSINENRIKCGYVVAQNKFYVLRNGSAIYSSFASAYDTWHHIAIARYNGAFTLYINGAVAGSAADATDFQPARIVLGQTMNATTHGLDGWMDQFRVSKVARYTSAFTPPTTAFITDADTVHLFTFDDGHGGQVLKDRAISGHPVFLGANSMVTNTRAKFGATALDGNAQVGNLKPHMDFAMGADDFLFDCWAYPTAFNGGKFLSLEGTGYDPRLTLDATGLVKLALSNNNTSYNVAADVSTGLSLTLNIWNHVALFRSGSTVYVAVNGITYATNVGTALIGFSGAKVNINRHDVTDNITMQGTIDAVRIERGRSLWAGNFTPPTTAPTATPYTLLLLNFEGANGDKVTLDSSGSSYGTNAFGDTTIPNLAFANGCSLSTAQTRGGHSTSLALNGSNQYAVMNFAAPSAGHPAYFGTNTKFCIEGWFYVSTLSGISTYAALLDLRAPSYGIALDIYLLASGQMQAGVRMDNSGTNLTINGGNASVGWNHFALVRDNRGYVLYSNGTAGASPTSPHVNPYYSNVAYNLALGAWGDGSAGFFGMSFDAIRITNGQPRYTTNFTPATLVADDMTTLMWEFNGAVGQKWVKELSGNSAMIAANGNARTVKDGRYIYPMLTGANCGITTSVSKFGTGALQGNGTSGNSYYVPHSLDLCPTSGFTIDFWVNLAASAGRLFYKTNNTNATISIYWNGSTPEIVFNDSAGTNNQWLGSAISTGVHHFALVLNGTTLTLYVDGVANTSRTMSSGSARQDTAGNLYLLSQPDGTQTSSMWIDEFRWSNTVRWTANFTPPTIPYGQQYVTGPYYVATLNSSRIDVSDWSTIHSATITQTTPPGTSIKWLVSFDGRATWRKWDGSAWVVVPLNNGSSIDTNGNDYLTMQNALTNLNVEAYSTIDFAFSLRTTNPNFSPSVDAVTLARDEYELGAAKTDYTIKRNGAAGAEIHRITNLKPYPVNVVYDYVA